MFLSDKDVLLEMEKGNITIEPYDRKWLGPNSYDLHLANKFKRYKWNRKFHGENGVVIFDPIDITKETFEMVEDTFPSIIKSGEMINIVTEETIGVRNDILGIMSARSNLARSPITLYFSLLTDTGFVGHLSAKLVNNCPYEIVLQPNLRICQLMFAKTINPVDISYDKRSISKNLDQIELIVPQYKIDKEFLNNN